MSKFLKACIAVLTAFLVITMTGCTTAAPSADFMVLHYEAGSFSSTKFKDCVQGGTRAVNGPGDRYFYYPLSIRFWDATGGKNADATPISSVSDDNAEMLTPVIVNFRFKNDCEIIRKFHDNIGNRSKAYFDDDQKESNDGWTTVLGRIMGKPLETIVDRTAQKFTWRDMWNKPAVRQQMEAEILAELPKLVAAQTGGDEYFDGWTVTVSQPSPKDEKLLQLARDEQNQVAQANSVKAKAEADKASAEAQAALAEAQVKIAKAEAAKIRERTKILGVDGYLKEVAIEKGISPYATVVGTPLTTATK